MSFDDMRGEVRAGIRSALDSIGAGEVGFSVEPARAGFGDASSNVAFLLARVLKKSPRDVARLVEDVYPKGGPLVRDIQAHRSGYVNFYADWEALSRVILEGCRGGSYGTVQDGAGTSIVVEHTSVNPNKALHIGHVRNVSVGDSISRILRRAGYGVTVLNYVDDSGLQVADIVLGFERMGFGMEPPGGKKFDHYCGDDVYVRASEACQRDPALRQARDRILKEMEDGGSESAMLADRVTRRVLEGQLKTCWMLGASYDCLNFESHILRSGMWGEIFERLKEMSIAEFEEEGENAGCWVIRGEHDKVIVRSSGTATYVAKDIPYAAWKLGILKDPFGYERHPSGRGMWQTVPDGGGAPPRPFSGERVITVIDSRQSGLQRIISDVMGRFKSSPDAYVHLGYESVTLSPETARALGAEGAGRSVQMSGRRGLYVSADAVYERMAEKAAGETRKRHPDMDPSEVRGIAHAVSAGTMRYEMIKQDLDKIITFDMARSLSMEGDTASYVQYAFARASRILEKAGRTAGDPDFALYSEEQELLLIRRIGMLEAAVRDAAANLSPKVMARYCRDLAVEFNLFYEGVRVMGAGDAGLEDARLYLVESFRIAMRSALESIGIEAPGRM